MAITYLNTDGGSGVKLVPANGETYFLPAGNFLDSTDTAAIRAAPNLANNIDLIIGGTVTAEFEAISMSPGTGGGTDLGVTVLDTGFISNRVFSVISLGGDGNYVINHGTILGHNFNAVQLTGSNARVENHGSIHLTRGLGNTSSGIDLFTGTGTHNVLNSGDISVDSANGAAVRFRAAATTLVENHGSLVGPDRAVWDENAAGIMTLLNTGSIAGRVDLGGGADQLTNAPTGTIQGQIHSSSGADQIVNQGTIADYGDAIVAASANFAHIFNAGLISAGGSAIRLTGSNLKVENTGEIEAFAYGVWTIGDEAAVSNDGTITGLSTGILLEGSLGRVVNSGQIAGKTNAIFATQGGNEITNTGIMGS